MTTSATSRRRRRESASTSPAAALGARDAAWQYVTCFVSGAAILVLEVLGFRLFAPYFGSSVYVTGTLVGVVLVALSLGYAIGGALADRVPEARVMYAAILAAAAYLALVVAGYHALLEGLQALGLVAGTLAAAITMFAPPMLALSVVSPYLIRLAAVQGRIGSIAGRMFAVSTVGSIAGSFLATFLFVPELGSHRTLVGCVAVLLALGAGGLWRTAGRAAPALVALLLLLPSSAPSDGAVLFRTESAYNTIEIRETDGIRSMTLNQPRWRQSYLARPEEAVLDTYREYFALAPFLTEVRTVLILGASAGASLTELRHWFDVSIDAVDIDPEVLRLAREWFGVREDVRTRLHAADARPFLARAQGRWDFVEVDLFHGGPDMPFYVATREFFALVRARLSERGIVMMNVLGTLATGRDELVRAVGRTMAAVFPAVYALPFEGNTVLLATAEATSLEGLRARLVDVAVPALQPFADTMRKRLVPMTADGPPLTDDHAPIERMTYRLLAALGGD